VGPDERLLFLGARIVCAQPFAYYDQEILSCLYDILSREPAVVGISVHSSSYISARLLGAKIKQLAPGVKVVFGGPHVSDYTTHWQGLFSAGIADAVVFGEGERTLPEYLRALSAHAPGPIPGCAYVSAGGDVVSGGKRDLIPSLDDIPFPDFSGFDLRLYNQKHVLPTYFSRGCINQCIFCTEKRYFPKFRNRTGARVFDEVRHQLSRYPDTRYFRMHDSVSNGNVKELESSATCLSRTAFPSLEP